MSTVVQQQVVQQAERAMSTILKPGAQQIDAIILKQGAQINVELSLPVQKLWDALRNLHNVAPKISLNLKHTSLQGSGGVGSVSLINFPDGRSQKERVDVVDERTHTLVSTVTSQESTKGFSNQYTKTMALFPARDGTTTIARWRAECAAPPVGASLVSDASDDALVFLKALESYLTTV